MGPAKCRIVAWIAGTGAGRARPRISADSAPLLAETALRKVCTPELEPLIFRLRATRTPRTDPAPHREQGDVGPMPSQLFATAVSPTGRSPVCCGEPVTVGSILSVRPRGVPGLRADRDFWGRRRPRPVVRSSRPASGLPPSTGAGPVRVDLGGRPLCSPLPSPSGTGRRARPDDHHVATCKAPKSLPRGVLPCRERSGGMQTQGRTPVPSRGGFC